MFKKGFVLVVLSVLTACTGDSGSSQSDAAASGGDGKSIGGSDGGLVKSSALHVSSTVKNVAVGQSIDVEVDISQLVSDEVVYFSVSSAAIEGGAIAVTPQKTIIYPSKKSANIKIDVKNIALTSQANLLLSLRTASNQVVEVNYVINGN